MASGERCLMVHGHFYQPPRENPWTGTIDPQHSAHPWENWNVRIADECYLPMAGARLPNARGETIDLGNNYAHTSFNFGPTLLSWLADSHPRLIRRLQGAALNNTCAMAQVYNHMMLPLADTRDRHTQILWGLAEFQRRFGHAAEGMWLSECGIDRETVRALIDHGVRFVVLSPHQASTARPFGEAAWQDVSMGAVDTRRAYRLFETDGGGRTHFNRSLDVLFCTSGLNLKVSFDHILNRPDDLARELEACYLPDYPGAQLASIVTDGEIYGHHEKRGEEALARLFEEIAPRLGLRICSALEFVRDHPPAWEARLWDGEEGKGSSWSCRHGMGRWMRDCGCAPQDRPGWRQDWRAPLRDAFDALRDKVRDTARRELEPLLVDVDEARDGYIAVVLDPGIESRQAFLRRHARRPISTDEAEMLWRLLEALHNAMLMYTSCGWFFDELSGLEPVQNMRYALRAAELAQPYRHDDLSSLLAEGLALARSNLPRYGDGAGVFRELVLPSRRSNRELAAALAACFALGLPTDRLAWRMAGQAEGGGAADDGLKWGAFVCHDPRLDRYIRTRWAAWTGDADNLRVILSDYRETQGDPNRPADAPPPVLDADFSWLDELRRLPEADRAMRFAGEGIGPRHFPEAIHAMIHRHYNAVLEEETLGLAAKVGMGAASLLAEARQRGAKTPARFRRLVADAAEHAIAEAGRASLASLDFSPEAAERLAKVRREAEALDLHPSTEEPARALHLAAREFVQWFEQPPSRDWLASFGRFRLPDGADWVAPIAPCNRALAYPEADAIALALGKGLARLADRLAAEADPARAALEATPLPELLAFARRAGLVGVATPPLAIAYWDFLGKPLAKLIAADPAGAMAAIPGDRVRRIGVELGFAPEAVERRILAAMKGEA